MSRGPLSVLELLHPQGGVERSLVFGGGCPATLTPPPACEGDRHADLIVLAPTVDEWRARSWLETAVESIAQRLTPDGVAYVLAPRPWRATAERLLRARGLHIEQSFVHLPDAASSRYLVPIARSPVHYLVSQFLPAGPWILSSRLARSRLVPLEMLVERVSPWIGLIMRRAGARRIFDWLFQMQPALGGPGPVMIGTSWRGQQGAVILHRFCGRAALPSAIAKISLSEQSGAGCTREATMLTRLGPLASRAGATVPRLLSWGLVNHRPVLLQSPISGRSYARQLAFRPKRLSEVLDRVTAWLERWNGATRTIKIFDAGLQKRDFLTPAAALAPLLDHGGEYRQWLENRSSRFLGKRVPIVATHNDLTMWNIFGAHTQELAIIDWEAAHPDGLPFVDFFYAAVDGVAATENYADRFIGFKHCFLAGGAHESVITPLVERLRRAIPTSDNFLELCFHACWIHHAANEHRSTGRSDGPFIKIVQWLARKSRQSSSCIRA